MTGSEILTEEERRQMRIAVANDVLKHLHDMRVKTHGYVEGNIPLIIVDDDDMQKHVPLLRKACDVCAKGAMILSYVGLYDKVKMGNIFDLESVPDEPVTEDETQYVEANDRNICDILSTGFDEDQLELIEAAFELWNHEEAHGDLDDDAAMDFGNQFDDPKDRLQAIMQNIIDHDGDFHPEVVYEDAVAA